MYPNMSRSKTGKFYHHKWTKIYHTLNTLHTCVCQSANEWSNVIQIFPCFQMKTLQKKKWVENSGVCTNCFACKCEISSIVNPLPLQQKFWMINRCLNNGSFVTGCIVWWKINMARIAIGSVVGRRMLFMNKSEKLFTISDIFFREDINSINNSKIVFACLKLCCLVYSWSLSILYCY